MNFADLTRPSSLQHEQKRAVYLPVATLPQHRRWGLSDESSLLTSQGFLLKLCGKVKMAYTYTAEMELACHRQFPLAKTATFRLRQVDRHVQVARPGITDQGSESFQRSCKLLFCSKTKQESQQHIAFTSASEAYNLAGCWLSRLGSRPRNGLARQEKSRYSLGSTLLLSLMTRPIRHSSFPQA